MVGSRYVFILSLVPENKSCHFSAWLVDLRRRAMAADKNCILKVISSKSTNKNGLKRKTSLSKSFSKLRTAKIFVSLHEKGCFSGTIAPFRSREVSLKSIFKALDGKIILENKSCHFSAWLIHIRRHGYWQELHSDPFESRFLKISERAKAKKISLGALSKRRTVEIWGVPEDIRLKRVTFSWSPLNMLFYWSPS